MEATGERRRAVRARLERAGCVAASEEADELVAGASDEAVLEEWLALRESGVPIAWITGTVRFCGLDLALGHGTYVPRQQSEELARRARVRLAASIGRRAADLCTGTGAVAAVLLAGVARARVVGVDLDGHALCWARRNGVPAVLGDLGAPLAKRSFDLVTAVAPYVPTAALATLPADVQRYEPRLALDGGDDGLAVLARVVADAARVLVAGGWLMIELGGDEDELVAPLLTRHGFSPLRTWADGDGDLRGGEAQLSLGA